MRRYRDSKTPPSLLLLQAILLAGSRVCTNPQLMDANGSTTPAAMTFYKRAKALYDANYEDDRVTIVQALILMGWYWEVSSRLSFLTSPCADISQGPEGESISVAVPCETFASGADMTATTPFFDVTFSRKVPRSRTSEAVCPSNTFSCLPADNFIFRMPLVSQILRAITPSIFRDGRSWMLSQCFS